MKRRIISIFFCLLILMGLAVPAYAEENPNTDPINGMIETNLVSFEEPLIPMSSRTESESNNTRATADLIYAGDTMTGYVSTSSDIDCFKFVPTSSGTLTATMSSIPSGKIFKLCLQDSNGNALVFATNNSVAQTSKSFTYNVTAGTTYYIVAYSAGDYSTSDSYVVSVSLSGTSGGSGTTSGENILNVTRYTQEKTKWCWAACVKMNAGYKGYTKTQSQIVEHVHGSAENVTGSMSDVRDALKWISSTTFGAAEYKNITNDRYQSTFEIPEWYDPNSEMGRILRFLVAMKRTSSEPADTIETTTDSIVAYRNDNDTSMHLDVTFYCYPKKYDENTKEYIIIKNSSEKIRMLFMFNKINGEWVMEDDKLICGNLTDYAKKCMNRTWGRFPELDENEVVDFAICEYTEKLYDFGIIPGP